MNNYTLELEGEIEDEGYDKEDRKIYPINSNKITSSITTYDVFNLWNFLKRKKIEIQPIYQRSYVWKDDKAKLFIDSLWNNLPVPPLFFLLTEEWTFLMIDWQQRLTSLMRFILSEEEVLEFLPFLNKNIDTSINLRVSWEVFGLDTTKEYLFSELPDDIRNKMENKELNVIIIKPNYSTVSAGEVDLIIKEIFYRLNTWGVELTSQEIRQSLYTWDFMLKIREYSLSDEWKTFFPKSDKIKNEPSFYSSSLLRWIALFDVYIMKTEWIIYEKPFEGFLDEYAKITEKFSEKDIEFRMNLIKKVTGWMHNSSYASSVFKHKGWIKKPGNWKELNKNFNNKYIDTLFVGFLSLAKEVDAIDYKVIDKIIDDFKWRKEIISEVIKWGSSDEWYVRKRVDLWIKIIKDLYDEYI